MKEIKRIPEWQQKYIKDRFLEIRKKLNLCYSYLTELEDYILGD